MQDVDATSEWVSPCGERGVEGFKKVGQEGVIGMQGKKKIEISGFPCGHRIYLTPKFCLGAQLFAHDSSKKRSKKRSKQFFSMFCGLCIEKLRSLLNMTFDSATMTAISSDSGSERTFRTFW